MKDIAKAFQIVLDLARRNILAKCEPGDEMFDVRAEQIEACNIVEDIAVNQFDDDD